ncbi:MAG: LPS-assembly protein LptD [Muribaculaceae bacterium]|nr:LPS-assembly protein LptD [Muribaculaceae bacterium]
MAAMAAGPATGLHAALTAEADEFHAAAIASTDSVTPDSLPAVVVADTAAAADSTPRITPATAAAALLTARDTTSRRSRIVREMVDLDAPVVFSSSDSMVIVRRDSAFMYGNGSVTYGDIKLDAAQIEMNLGDNTVYAVGRTDSVGDVQGAPVFHEGGSDYEAATMRYNFKTSKGLITNVVTQQGEGYLTGGLTKKDVDDSYYIKDGRYTTCDDHDDPHFYLQLTKAKVRPGKNIVVGPAYMVLAGLPLPLAVPFGYFPFTDKYASGIIVPTFGDDYTRGFYLRDGGYYFAISDNIDLALTGEIYTKGSWGLNARSTYAKRYKYSGNFNLSYLLTKTGEKGSPDYGVQKNFQVLWSHSQDSKANPNMSLSASVNFTTSGYTRNDLNSYYSNAFTESTKSSTINMTYRFPQSKWSLSATMNVSQRTQDSTLTVGFPNLTITMSQTQPFKRKKAAGSERWYEKIKLSYNGQFQNSLTAKQNEFFQKSLIKDWRNGMNHRVPISATFNVLKYVNITPSIDLQDRMYTRKVRRQWDPVAGMEICDTTYSLYNVWDMRASVSMDTKLYGFFQPLGFLGKKVKMIRHVMTPSISFSAAPDFGAPFFGYYGQYDYTDPRTGKQQTRRYSMFPNALFGVPSEGKSGTISYSLANNLEMKVKTDNDSIGEKKISLIENLNISQSYNMAADSLRFSDINTSILLRLTKGFNLNLNATWDVYTYALNEAGNPVRVNKLRIASGKGLGRLRNTGTSFSYTFNNDTFRRKKDDKKKGKNNSQDDNAGGDDDNFDGQGMGQANRSGHSHGDDDETQMGADGYAKWEVPWSLSVNYSVNYSYGAFNKQKMEYDGRITQNLSFSGSIRPTKNWNFSFSASYNFDTHRLAYMNCNISRDLHCFQMSASFVPVGPYKSYNFHIAVKSSLLSDLKYDKRSSTSNGITWY